MPIDWDKFGQDVDAAIGNAGAKTDAILAGRIASVTRLTEEEVQEMFPAPGDAKKLGQLMQIVKGATERNQKINQIAANMQDFGGIVLKLLEKFA